MVFIDQHVIQSVSLPLHVEPSPFMLENKRMDHEKTLDGWVKGRYPPAARLKGAFDWVSLVRSSAVFIYEAEEKEL